MVKVGKFYWWGTAHVVYTTSLRGRYVYFFAIWPDFFKSYTSTGDNLRPFKSKFSSKFQKDIIRDVWLFTRIE